MLLSVQQQLHAADSLVLELDHFISRFEQTKAQLALPRPLPPGLTSFVRLATRDRDLLQALVQEIPREKTAKTEKSMIAEKEIKHKIENCLGSVNHITLQWDILTRCRSLAAVNQPFQGSSKETITEELRRKGVSGKEKEYLRKELKTQAKAEVHVVDGGNEWIEIRPLQPDRLARQMTDAGWPWGESELGDEVARDEWEDIPLAKQVKKLVAAARLNRHEYRIPRIRIVLPNLGSEEHPDILIFLDQLHRTDPLVKVIIELKDGEFMKAPPPNLDVAVGNLLGNELEMLTPILNMDHPLLIDMISDVTHYKLEPQDWQESSTRAQIVEEQQHDGGLMARTLYRVLKNRTLVCTREAAEHFHEVLLTVGTKSERERGHLLVPKDNSVSVAEARRRFAELSVYGLPESVQFPVTILSDEKWDMDSIQSAVQTGRLPKVALDVARHGDFKSAKLSIYMHGWATGFVTVTSNREIHGQISTGVEAHRHTDDEVGPAIFRVRTTRNLLSKNATPPPGWNSDK